MDNEDEFIADSEEELSMDSGIDNNMMDWKTRMDDAGKRGETQTPGPGLPKTMSSVSQFTNDADVSTSVSAFTTPSMKPPRPRPRPIPPKKKILEGALIAPTNKPSSSLLDRTGDVTSPHRFIEDRMAFNNDISDFPVMSSIADRAKTRQRKVTYSGVPQWDEEDFVSPPAKKIRPSVKPQTTIDPNSAQTSASAKEKGKAKVSSDIIELTDASEVEEGEVMLREKTCATKSKPLAPKLDTPHLPGPTIKPPRPKPRPIPQKKKVTSDDKPSERQPANHESTAANQPPESDIMPPFPTSRATTDAHDLPQIEILPEAHSDSHEPSNGYKRQSEVDELFSGEEDMFSNEKFVRQPHPADPKSLPPPPTFFAGSSSQIHPDDNLDNSAQQDVEIVDLTMFPTMPIKRVGVASLLDTEVSRVKEKRKKKCVDHDDDDADWGAAPSKPKVKKAPVKRKKVTKPPPEGQGQVEVVISATPLEDPDKGDKAKKKKAKGKGKCEGGSGNKADEAKDNLKSKEMIEDSDEDPLLDYPRLGEASATSFSPAAITYPEKDRLFQSSFGPGEALEPLSPLPEDMAFESAVAVKDDRKKRKSIVVQDDEDFDEISRVEDSPTKRRKKSSGREKKGKSKATQILSDDQDEDPAPRPLSLARNIVSKENVEALRPDTSQVPKLDISDTSTPRPRSDKPSHLRHSLVSRARSTPMSELIKRVNSLPNSPFPPAASSRVPTIGKTATAYSPYLKSSRSLLSKIAPLHPNRRTPPPPLPPAPPKRKTKKELEREERWEEEMVESVGGIEAWAAMSDMERREMRKAKVGLEMGGWED